MTESPTDFLPLVIMLSIGVGWIVASLVSAYGEARVIVGTVLIAAGLFYFGKTRLDAGSDWNFFHMQLELASLLVAGVGAVVASTNKNRAA